MSTLEDIDFDNIALIEKYLANQLSPSEKKAFQARLRTDPALKEDLRMVMKTYRSFPYGAKLAPTNPNYQDRIGEQPRLERKAALGRNLVSNGLAIIWGALMLLMVSTMFISYFF